MKHVISGESIKSKIWHSGGRPAAALRWRCSCGRIGPELPKSEASRVDRGGRQHVAAATRKARR